MPTEAKTTAQLQLLTWSQRYNYADYNPSDVSLTDYCTMLKRSSTVRFAYDFLRFNVKRRLGDYHHEDQRVEVWVTERVLPAALDAVAELLSAVYFGMALGELVWRPRGAELELAQVHVCHPEVWWYGHSVRDGWRQVTGWVGNDGTQIEFFAPDGTRQIVHHTWGADFDNAFGDPAARRLYPWNELLKEYIKWEGIGCETGALGRMVLMHNGTQEEGDEYVEAWSQLGMNGALAFPSGKVTSLEAVPGGFGGGSPFDVPIRRAVTGVFAALYQPPLIHTEAQFGTRAQATTQLEAWVGTETSLAEDLADDVLVAQVIAPGIALQFGPDVEPGSLTIRDSSPPDLNEWDQHLQALTNLGSFDPVSEESLQFVAERYGLDYDERLKTAGKLPGVAQQGETMPPEAPPEQA